MGVLKARVNGVFTPTEYSGGPNPSNALGIVATDTRNTDGQFAYGAVIASLTFTAPPARRYSIRWYAGYVGSPVGLCIIRITAEGVAQDQRKVAAAGEQFSGNVAIDDWRPSAGVQTVQVVAYPPTGNLGVYGATMNARFVIEDIGPTASPALPVPATPPAWTPLPFAADWNDLAALYSCHYRKIGDEVQLRGLAARRNTIANVAKSVIAVLPAGFHLPSRAPYFSANRGDVATNGQVFVESGSLCFNGTAPYTALPVGSWVSLEQVRYSVTP